MADVHNARYVEMIANDNYRAQCAAVERACEASLQGGEHGVLTTSKTDGTFASAEVNSLVPYGQIYETRLGS